jgi:hypothetical protein
VWKQTSQPTVQRHRERWVVRVAGIDTETGQRRPRQVGTFTSRRSAQAAATSFAASGGHLVDQWVACKLDVSSKTRLQYEWAAGHIKTGLGAVRLDRLERDDVARWLEGLASGGDFSRRSIQIFWMVLRAALDDAVATGELLDADRSPLGVDRGRAAPLPDRDRRPPLGGAPTTGSALRAAPE